MKVGTTMSITSILALLENLEKLHKSMLRLANDKTAIITKGDMEGLDQLLKDEQSHLAAIAQTEKQRQNAVAEYLTEQGHPVPPSPTVTDLFDVVTEEEKTALEEVRTRLLHTIHDLKWQNDLNQKLTYQSLQVVNLSLDLMRPQAGTGTVNYSKTEIDGRNTPKDKTSFDSQA
jgi:hypothetical protein